MQPYQREREIVTDALISISTLIKCLDEALELLKDELESIKEELDSSKKVMERSRKRVS